MVAAYLLAEPPSWVLPGAVFDLDYANGRYYNSGYAVTGGGSVATAQSSVTRGTSNSIVQWSPILEQNGVRALQSFSANQIRSTIGYGLWSDGIRTNVCLQSRDFTNASWTKTSCTAARTTGADGIGSSGSTMTATGVNATCLQALACPARMTSYLGATIAVAGTGYTANDPITVVGGTFTTATKVFVGTVSGGVPQTLIVSQGETAPGTVLVGSYTALPTNPTVTTGGTGVGLTLNIDYSMIFSAYVKRVTGSGSVFMSYDGSTFVDITSQINSTTYTLVSIPVTTTLAAGGTPGFKLATSGDVIAVDHVQLENRKYPTTPLTTTTAVVTNTSDEPTFGDTSGANSGSGYALIRSVICQGGEWSMVVSASGNTFGTPILSDVGVSMSLGTNGAGASMTAGAGNLNSGLTSNTGTFGQPNINKCAGRIRSFDISCCLNGGAIATNAGTTGITTTASGGTHIGIGNNGTGDQAIEGYIKRVTIFARPLSDSEMQYYTSSTCPWGYNT